MEVVRDISTWPPSSSSSSTAIEDVCQRGAGTPGRPSSDDEGPAGVGPRYAWSVADGRTGPRPAVHLSSMRPRRQTARATIHVTANSATIA
jgi:hypothetical protein